jgi:hypothetical protein
MKSRRTLIAIFFAFQLYSCNQVGNSNKNNKEQNKSVDSLEMDSQNSGLFSKDPGKLKVCIENYSDFLITAKELINDSIFNVRNYSNIEKIEIDSSSTSILYIDYSFKINDSLANYVMTIYSTLSFEESDYAAKQTLSLWNQAHNYGFSSIDKGSNFKLIKMDSALSFGISSKFFEFRNKDLLLGYYLSGRTKNIVFSHYIISNHISHYNHIEVLNEKMEKLKEFANKYENKNGL